MTHYKQTELNLMSSQEDSPAKTSQLQDQEKESSENDHLFGRSMRGSSKMYGQRGQLLKMYLPFDLKDLPWSYKISARSGTMQNGIAYPVPQLVGYTEEIDSGSSPIRWRTPDAHSDRGASSKERMKMKLEKGMPISINDQVAHREMIDEHKKQKKIKQQVFEELYPNQKFPTELYPTPCARDWKDSINKVPPSVGKTRGHSLGQMVAERGMWPTPCARDWRGASSVQTMADKIKKGIRAQMDQLPNRVALEESLNILSQENRSKDLHTMPKPNGQLNPNWTEWLMGYPIGYTDLKE